MKIVYPFEMDPSELARLLEDGDTPIAQGTAICGASVVLRVDASVFKGEGVEEVTP